MQDVLLSAIYLNSKGASKYADSVNVYHQAKNRICHHEKHKLYPLKRRDIQIISPTDMGDSGNQDSPFFFKIDINPKSVNRHPSFQRAPGAVFNQIFQFIVQHRVGIVMCGRFVIMFNHLVAKLRVR